MNNFTGKTVVFYNSAIANYLQLIAANVIRKAVGEGNITIKDVAGVSAGNLTTYCGTTLVDNTYDDIVVLSAISTGGTTAVLSYDQLCLLIPKLKTANQYGTKVATGTCGTTGGTTSICNLNITTTGYDVADYFNGLTFVCTGGTITANIGAVKKILDYGTTNTLATFGGAVCAADWVAGGATFNIYKTPHLVVVQDPAIIISTAYLYDLEATYTIPEYTWYLAHPDNTPPFIIEKTGTKNGNVTSGTATTSTTTTLVGNGVTWVANAYAGMYVYTRTGAGLLGQWAYIVSNDTTTLTCKYFNNPNYLLNPHGGTATWTAPTSATFVIVNNFSDILVEAYLQLYIKTYLRSTTYSDITDQGYTTGEIWGKLLDWYDNLTDKSAGPPTQDMVFIQGPSERYSYRENTMLSRGKAIYDALGCSTTLT
jgi:hypothetical protein